MMPRIDWIAVDWGTTHLRGWAMSGAQVVAKAQSSDGMGNLNRDAFEPALLKLISEWVPVSGTVDVICCGMVGSRQGWAEAPYRSVPCAIHPEDKTVITARDPRLRVSILPGLSQQQPADVMRGEETQIAGFLAQNPNWDGVICLPGTHTKWVHVSANEVVSFQTFMTGELFAALSEHTVIKHSVQSEDWHGHSFEDAVADAMSKPEALAARLFRLRASDLLHKTEGSVTRAQLSGLLIGAELAAARPYWLGQNVAIIGAEKLSSAYATALAMQGMRAELAQADAMTLAGLTAARRQVETVA